MIGLSLISQQCAYTTRVLEIEKGTFTLLVFTATGGMGEECFSYHRRLAELLALKKGEDYAKTMNWIRVIMSFSLIRSALVYLKFKDLEQFAESLTTLWTSISIFRQLRVVLEDSELNHGHEF